MIDRTDVVIESIFEILLLTCLSVSFSFSVPKFFSIAILYHCVKSKLSSTSLEMALKTMTLEYRFDKIDIQLKCIKNFLTNQELRYLERNKKDK